MGSARSSLLCWLFSLLCEQGLWILYIKYINLAGAWLGTGVLLLLVLVSPQHSIIFFFFFFFWLCWFGFAARGLSLVGASRSYSLDAVCRLLTAIATLVAESKLWSTGSVLVLYRLVPPVHVVSSQTRDQTFVQCIGRRIFLPLDHQGVATKYLSTEEIPVSFKQDPRVSFNWGAKYVNIVPNKIWCSQPITGWSEKQETIPQTYLDLLKRRMGPSGPSWSTKARMSKAQNGACFSPSCIPLRVHCRWATAVTNKLYPWRSGMSRHFSP